MTRKNEPWGSLYNDKKSEKNSGWRRLRLMHTVRNGSTTERILIYRSDAQSLQT